MGFNSGFKGLTEYSRRQKYSLRIYILGLTQVPSFDQFHHSFYTTMPGNDVIVNLLTDG